MATIFDTMLGSCSKGEVWALSMPNTRGEGPSRHVATRSNERLEKFCKKHDEAGFGTYFCVSTIEDGRPRKKENARQSAFGFNDIDFKDHDISPEEILDTLLAQRCPPSRIHSTGGGYHNFWLLDAPVGPDQADRFERLLKRLAEIFGADPTVCHRVALLRVPGTTNTKREESKRVTVIRETNNQYSLDELEDWLDGFAQPVLFARGANRVENPFLRAASNQALKAPIDVEQRLRNMRYLGEGENSVHSTQLSVSASLMSAGVDIDEVVATILEATKLVGEPDWNWGAEERAIRGMCTDWLKKHPRQAINGPSLNDASGHRNGRDHPILDAADPMRSARAMYESQYVDADEKDTLVRHRGEFFKWSGACYQINAEEAQRGEIWRFLDKAQVKNKEGNLVPFKPKKDNVTNVYEALGAICAVDDHVEPPAWIGGEPPIAPPKEFFAAANGLLHLPTRRLYDPTPSYFGVTASSVAYDPDAAPPTQWLTYLQQTVADDEAISTLQEWMGYTLGGDTSQQKILFCIGPRRSGKGTFARIHTALLGKNSVGGPTMSSFGTQFGLAPLITKSLAIVSDARIGKKTDRAAVTERLLTISGEDTIDVDRKYGTMWTGRLPTRIAILTNELPAFSEGSGALAGRFLVVLFQTSFFGREDPGLTERLMGELPGILNWAIEGYVRLQARGHFVQPANALEQIEAIERLGNPVKAFVADRCVVGPGRQIETDVLYDDWRVWCGSNGGDPGNKDWFGRNLRAAVPGLTTARPEAEGRRVPVYRGVGIEPPDITDAPGYRLTQGARRSGAT